MNGIPECINTFANVYTRRSRLAADARPSPLGCAAITPTRLCACFSQRPLRCTWYPLRCQEARRAKPKLRASVCASVCVSLPSLLQLHQTDLLPLPLLPVPLAMEYHADHG